MKNPVVLVLLVLVACAGFAEPTVNGYLFMFDQTPDAAISGHNEVRLQNVSTEEAAEACVLGGFRSFDYHREERTADLSYATAQSVGGLKTDYDGNPYDHYVYLGGGEPEFFREEGEFHVVRFVNDDGAGGPVTDLTIESAVSLEFAGERAAASGDEGKPINIPAYRITLEMDLGLDEPEELSVYYCPRCDTYYILPNFDGGLLQCEGHESVVMYWGVGSVTGNGRLLTIAGEHPRTYQVLTYHITRY